MAEARSLSRRSQLLRRRSLCGFGVLAAEPLYAPCRVDQALFASKERVAIRADFDVNVALVGRPRLKIVSAGAHYLHCGIVGMNLFLGHRYRQTFPTIFRIYCIWIRHLAQTIQSPVRTRSHGLRSKHLNLKDHRVPQVSHLRPGFTPRLGCANPKFTVHRFLTPSRSPLPPAEPSHRIPPASDAPHPDSNSPAIHRANPLLPSGSRHTRARAPRHIP
jgi:hypothetical protein